MAKTKEKLNLTDAGIATVIGTLTIERMKRYMINAKNDQRVALSLYMHNAKVSAALLTDIHFLEVALRNKFASELASIYGVSGQYWYDEPAFHAIVTPTQRGKQNTKAIKSIAYAKQSIQKSHPNYTYIPPGKLVAELTFGFWHALTNRHLEHTLWVPVLSKCFSQKIPARAVFNAQLETIRQLRNRVAHHEPIIHLQLEQKHKELVDATSLLCSSTVQLLKDTSTVKTELMALKTYTRRKGI